VDLGDHALIEDGVAAGLGVTVIAVAGTNRSRFIHPPGRKGGIHGRRASGERKNPDGDCKECPFH
jgi:hypothetical protein